MSPVLAPGAGFARPLLAWSIGLLVAATLTGCGTTPIEQPIAFDHAKHGSVGLECSDCHQHYATAEFSGLPRIEVCLECHEEPDPENAGKQLILEYAARKEQIPWRRVYHIPDHVYYSHRRHVVAAHLVCETCHGDIGALTSPPPRPLVTQDMGWCLDCHEKSHVTTDCIHCHR